MINPQRCNQFELIVTHIEIENNEYITNWLTKNHKNYPKTKIILSISKGLNENFKEKKKKQITNFQNFIKKKKISTSNLTLVTIDIFQFRNIAKNQITT